MKYFGLNNETNSITNVNSNHTTACDTAFSIMGEDVGYCVLSIDQLGEFTTKELEEIYRNFTAAPKHADFEYTRKQLIATLYDVINAAPCGKLVKGVHVEGTLISAKNPPNSHPAFATATETPVPAPVTPVIGKKPLKTQTSAPKKTAKNSVRNEVFARCNKLWEELGKPTDYTTVISEIRRPLLQAMKSEGYTNPSREFSRWQVSIGVSR